MQLAIKATGEGAKMLSFLLSKNPQNLYDRSEKGYRVRLTYTVFTDTEVEAVLIVTPDPVELVKNSPDVYDITQYINDREFVTSSLFCSYARSALGTALNGRPKEEYSEWVNHAFNLTISFGPVASDLPDAVINDLFEYLGYEVTIERGQADYRFQLKERSSARFISISGLSTVQAALKQLFVLIPVLDNYKHYYLSEQEIDKLQRYGEGWLDRHPLRELIIKRSLRFQDLIDQAALIYGDKRWEQPAEGYNVWKPAVGREEIAKTAEIKGIEELEELEELDGIDEAERLDGESARESAPFVSLNEQRYQAIVKIVENIPAKQTLVDFGAGEGKLSVRLGFIPGVKEILAVEPTERAQLRAIERFDKAARREAFVKPIPVWGSLFYYDERLRCKDVMILCEVIEHIDEYRLPGTMECLFKEYQPKTLIVTTPNAEYNAFYQMPEKMRHKDHRFEWTRQEFSEWCNGWANLYPYEVQIEGIGDQTEEYGQPTQTAIFTRQVGEADE